MKFQKRYVISAAILLALGAAVYVNWQFNSTAASTPKELGAASYVNATVACTDDEAVETSALSKEQRNYFATERTKRQATQDKVIDEAKEIFDLENADEGEVSEAQKKVEQILKNFTIQDSISARVGAERLDRADYRRCGDFTLRRVLREHFNSRRVMIKEADFSVSFCLHSRPYVL